MIHSILTKATQERFAKRTVDQFRMLGKGRDNSSLRRNIIRDWVRENNPKVRFVLEIEMRGHAKLALNRNDNTPL